MGKPTDKRESNMPMEREAATAAKWWADQLLSTQAPMAIQAAATDPSEPMSSPMASVVFALGAAVDRCDSPADAERFRACLEARLTADLASYPHATFGTDYGPDHFLGAVADTAGMRLGMQTLPVKTWMRVAPGSVKVSKGYAAPLVDVPLIDVAT